MKTRKEVAKYINETFYDSAGGRHKTHWHYGVQELRVLMDFIYSGEPQGDAECVDPKAHDDLERAGT